jgi:hypothetical protein
MPSFFVSIKQEQMECILNKLFTLNDFWSDFKQIKKNQNSNSLYIVYEFKKDGHHIIISFSEIDGLVKSFALMADKKKVVDHVFFTNFSELYLILSRVASVRVASPLCIDSLSILTLSSLQKMNI